MDFNFNLSLWLQIRFGASESKELFLFQNLISRLKAVQNRNSLHLALNPGITSWIWK